MKQVLLTMAAVMLAAGSAFAQEETDITPSMYKYGERTTVGQETIQRAFHGANANGVTVDSLRRAAVEEFESKGGFFFVSGGQFHNAANGYAANVQAGTSIVDLGGEVGKVLCINGQKSKFNEKYDTNYPAITGGTNWFNLDWTTDPNNTPTGGSKEMPNIRIRIVMNTFSNTPGAADAIINSITAVTCQNGVVPYQDDATTSTGRPVYTGDFVETYEDGEPVTDDDENMIYDPTKWMVYEWDAFCPAKDDDAVEDYNKYAPLRVKMEMNSNTLANATLFIKDITFTKLEGDYTPILGKRQKTYKTYTVDPQKVAASINAISADNANAEKQVYTIDGKRVNANSLAKGVYVVKQGDKTAKYVVK